MPFSKLRIVRPTHDLGALLPFYRDGLGMQILGVFDDLAGFDGMVLGRKDTPYHLEFVRRRRHRPALAALQEQLLVFYLAERADWQAAVDGMRAAGAPAVKSALPFWDARGLTFEDPDGYRVVLQQGAWRISSDEGPPQG
ncbi:MAG: VOC family protein [Rhodocyclaceae bacterium]|nr:VOC family protein [Pseudomonadota bacterium]MDQ7973032.1 VOC family protein [Rhodocyclaceae bacterium]MDQ7998237.1 VOC family protein [Pseudomonadota bacterium]MDQ8017088.1 VOC family protein [Pseudomonadota bacterium]